MAQTGQVGEQVGATGKENALAVFVKREYPVPGKLVKAGKNTIAVRVFDRQGPGGFGAVAGEMKIEKADKQTGRQGDKEMALAGEWKYPSTGTGRVLA